HPSSASSPTRRSSDLFAGGGSLLVDRRAGWLVLVPVVKLVATLGALPQTTSDQLAHGRVRVVAEPCGHAGRHEPVGEVACGPARSEEHTSELQSRAKL